MKIIVCVKQVPNTNEVKIDPQTGTMIREGIPSIINPDDLCGLEAALQLKDKYGCQVTAVSMGPPQADIALREALAMGCDEAYLLSDRAFGGADTWATSKTLAGAIKKHTAQVGPQIAEHLGIPQVTYVEDINIKDGSLILKRQFEDSHQIIKVDTPVLITTLSELNEPRYMSVGGIVSAYREKEVKLLKYEDIKDLLDPATIGLKGSPTNVVRAFTKEPKAQGALLKGITTAEAVDAIMARLHESHLI
jgi:electron transfer flavoprotein beta subunit